MVESDTLRALQAPLKRQYRDDPSSAVVTLHAAGSLGEGITCSVESGRALAVATSMGLPLTDGTVRAEGDLDFRGTLGVGAQAPVGFRAIRLTFGLATTASATEVAKLLELTERYCVVFQTLAGKPALSVDLVPAAPS